MEKTISYKDMVFDLSIILTNMLRPFNVKYIFDDNELEIDEVFMKCGCMPIFLINKQEFINKFLANKKLEYYSDEPYAEIILHNSESSFFNLKVEIQHNLYNTDYYKKDVKVYCELIEALVFEILNEDILNYDKENNTIKLDNNYDSIWQFINQKNNLNK